MDNTRLEKGLGKTGLSRVYTAVKAYVNSFLGTINNKFTEYETITTSNPIDNVYISEKAGVVSVYFTSTITVADLKAIQFPVPLHAPFRISIPNYNHTDSIRYPAMAYIGTDGLVTGVYYPYITGAGNGHCVDTQAIHVAAFSYLAKSTETSGEGTDIVTLTAADYVVEYGEGYTKWNSGKLECWGNSAQITSAGYATVILPISCVNSSYMVSATPLYYSSSYPVFECSIQIVSADTFYIYTRQSSGATLTGVSCSWYAIGKWK